MTLKDYDSSTLNGDGGGANFRGILVTKVPHGRTHSKVRLFVGAQNPGYTPDRYRAAVGNAEWSVTPSTWTETPYPGGLAYYQPPAPSATAKMTGAWLEAPIANLPYDQPVPWSIEAAGLGRWTACTNATHNAWTAYTMEYDEAMDRLGTLTGGFTATSNGVAMGLLGWGFDVSGAPIYGIGVLGDSTFSGIRPLDSMNALSLEGAFWYASIAELANGMRWWCSCWGNGTYSMDDYLTRGVSLLPILAGKVQLLIIQSWTWNQAPDSVESAQAQQIQLLAFKALAETAGYAVVFAIIHPQGDLRRSAGWDAGWDEQAAWTAAQGGIVAASAVWDPADHRRFLDAYSIRLDTTTEQIHLSEDGCIASGAALSPMISAQLSALGAF